MPIGSDFASMTFDVKGLNQKEIKDVMNSLAIASLNNVSQTMFDPAGEVVELKLDTQGMALPSVLTSQEKALASLLGKVPSLKGLPSAPKPQLPGTVNGGGANPLAAKDEVCWSRGEDKGCWSRGK
jgi:hypothetical protein